MVFGILVALPGLARAESATNAVISPHLRDLVVLQKNDLVPFKADDFLKAHYTILYYSAGWCPDCRAFSPVLVKAYDKQPKGSGRFEVLLLSQDKSAKDMLDYMRSEKMKWPALAYDKLDTAEDFKNLDSGHGIPCLTVIDQKGAVVLQSKSDQDAKEILKKLQELLAKKGSSTV